MSVRLSAFAFLAIYLLLTVVADSSSVRGGAPSDDFSLQSGEDPINGDEDDMVSPLQRMLMEGEIFDNDLFEQSMVQSSHRALNDDDCVENHGVDYFDIEISMHPTTAITNCQLADTVVLGHDINRLLWDYGVGESGENDGAIFVAVVCPKPTSGRRRQLGSALQPSGFIYPGIGGCRNYCHPDDNDARHLLVVDDEDFKDDSQQSRELTSAWFENTFKPQLENQMLAAITNDIVPQHQGCLGLNPTINVAVTGMSYSQLESPCSNNPDSDDASLGFLKTFNLADILLNPEHESCGQCLKIDFSIIGNQPVQDGDWIRRQYLDDYGVKITAHNPDVLDRAYTPNGNARIFDTSLHRDNDPDLGSPNKDCPGGGPGTGDGGKRGSGGENCDPVGMVLIIQQGGRGGEPSDNARGGTLRFDFEKPVFFSDIGLMDIDEKDHRLIFTTSDGSKKLFTFKGFGDNGVQRVIANQYDVIKLEVVFPKSGAITEINFCPECNNY